MGPGYVSDDYDDMSTGVAVDGSGNVYLTGSFLGNANFGGQDPLFGAPHLDEFSPRVLGHRWRIANPMAIW